MSDIEAELRSAFENTGYDLGDVSINRSQVRVTILQEGAEPAALREIIDEAVGEENVLTFNVSTETIDAQETVGTVATFRRR